MYIDSSDIKYQLQKNIKNINQLTQQLSTGKRINHASDDSAGLQISTRLTSQSNGTTQAIRNIQDGMSMLQTEDGTLATVQNMLQRIRELTVEGQNGTYTTDQKQSIQNEMQSLVNGINQITNNTNFNGISLFSGLSSSLSGVDVQNQRVDFENLPTDTSPGAKTTVEFWMNWDGSEGSAGVMPIVWGGSNGYALAMNKGTIGITTTDSGGINNIIGVPSSGVANKWTHIAVTFSNGLPNSSNVELYINGEKQDIKDILNPTITSRSVSSALRVGGWTFSGPFDFGGNVDELKIWNGSRTDDQIKNDMYNTNSTNDNNLLGYWSLNDSSIKDQTSHNNSGQLINGSSIVGDGVSKSLSIHTGTESNSTDNLNLFAVNDQTLNLSNISLSDSDLLNKIDNAINGVSIQRGEIGTKINQFNYQIDDQQTFLQNTEAANMRIQDQDMSSASSEITKDQIKLSTTVRMLTINNSYEEKKAQMLLS